MKKTVASVLLAVVACGSAQARRIGFSCDHVDQAGYRAFAETGKRLGATHVSACEIEESLWQWDAAQNRFDPYPNWSMHRPALMKFVTPAPLKPYFPEDYVRRNRTALAERAAILGELGLKAVFTGMEPMYWPERAFRDHPAWRGPRVDQARRARTEYYSPCMDNPEVRAMYVDAVEELCRICPFETFQLMTNDSGAGICWHGGLYSGQNGPLACKGRGMADRVADFLSVFQEGAARCGLKATVDIFAFLPSDVPAILAKLHEGQSCWNQTAKGRSAVNLIGFHSLTHDKTLPIGALPRLGWIARQIQAAQADPGSDIRISLRNMDEADTLALLDAYLHKPIGEGVAARWRALEDVAGAFVAAEDAAKLAEVWELIERIETTFNPVRTGAAHLMLTGCVHQRWLTRPFVAFPEELTGADRDYWRNYQMQARSEAEACRLTNIEANEMLGGDGALLLVGRMVRGTMDPLFKEAIAKTRQCRGKDAAGAKYVEATALKLEMYRALAHCIVNAIEFQNALDACDRSKPPARETVHTGWQGSVILDDLNRITRDEIDNTHEIIRLLGEAQKRGVRVLRTAESDAFETVMNLPTPAKLVKDLRRKTEIMEDHRRDFLRFLESRNR